MQSASSKTTTSRGNRRGRRAHRRTTTLRSALSRRGFTLFEMLLVLAVLAAAIGISWPALSRSYQTQRLRQAAEVVQVRMMAARVHALDTGLTYQFRCEPGGRRFVAIPAEQDPNATSTSSGETVETPKMGGLLPETVQFVADSPGGGGIVHLSDNDLKGLPNAQLYNGAKWGPAILFRADGTATVGEVSLVDKQKQVIRLTVRALTGGVTISSGQ